MFSFSPLSHNQKEPKNIVVFSTHSTKSDLTTLYSKTTRYYYFLLLQKFAIVMDELHWQNDFYIDVPNSLNDHFSKIAQALELIELRNDDIARRDCKIKAEKVPGLVGTTFRPYFTLYQEQKELRWNWEKLRPLVYETIFELKNDYSSFNSNFHEYEIPRDMEECFTKLDQELENFRKGLELYKTEKRALFWNELDGILKIRGNSIQFKPNSKRAKILSILISHKGQFVQLSELEEKMGYGKTRIRTEINQLRKRFARNGMSTLISIETENKGGYKLITS